MALPTPNLDDRSFQSIVDEAKSLIPRYCPEWTDHNLSDPGITLMELFAWMTELTLYRLNQVPEKNYIKFLDLLGINLLPPRAANAELTFRLSAPQSQKVMIPEGTEVATVRTEREESVVFTTDRDLEIDVPTLVECLATSEGEAFESRMMALELPEGEFLAFDPKPRPDNALLFGLGGDLGGNTLALGIDCKIEGIGVSPENPPLTWEAWCGERGWLPTEALRDTTGGLNLNGAVELVLPEGLAGGEFGGKYAHCWIRCRVIEPGPNQPFYESSPRIRGVSVHSAGGSVSATQATEVKGEILGISEGKPGQSFQLRNSPILAGRPEEAIEVISENGKEVETWQEVEDFANSGPDDRHFVCDNAQGLVRFGPAIREQDGTLKQFGAIPPKGSQIRFISYRCGGGAGGNVAAGTLTVLKSSIPYVAGVTNRKPARGGADLENLERAKLLAPKFLRARNRAVTAEDFEAFALRATPGIARAKCLGAVGSGDVVTVCVVPALNGSPELLTKQNLTLHQEVKKEIEVYLNERCLLTLSASVQDAEYIWVTVEAEIQAQPGRDLKRVREEAEKSLYRYLHPLKGGPSGDGWPFGRGLTSFELYPLLQRVEGVGSVSKIILWTHSDLEEKPSDKGDRLKLPPGGLICSGHHRVTVIQGI